jgi:hypothetical protein
MSEIRPLALMSSSVGFFHRRRLANLINSIAIPEDYRKDHITHNLLYF